MDVGHEKETIKTWTKHDIGHGLNKRMSTKCCFGINQETKKRHDHFMTCKRLNLGIIIGDEENN